MTAPLTFEEEMRRPGATLDNVTDPNVIGAYGLEWDGDDECRACDGDGFTFHSSPTNGATEIDGPCPSCDGTGRTPR